MRAVSWRQDDESPRLSYAPRDRDHAEVARPSRDDYPFRPRYELGNALKTRLQRSFRSVEFFDLTLDDPESLSYTRRAIPEIPGTGGGIQISADGSFITGDFREDGRSQAFGWTDDKGMFELGIEGRNITSVLPSFDGSVVLVGLQGFSNAIGTSFVWDRELGAVELGPTPRDGWNYLAAQAVSADGKITVGHYGPDGWGDWENNRAFVWDNHFGMRDLEAILISEYGFTETDQPRMEHAGSISDDRTTLLTYRRDNPFLGPWRLLKLDWPIGQSTDDGDMNFDDVVDASDIDLQMEAIRQFPKATFHDLDFSGQVNGDDLTYLIKNTLNTWSGDANLDGEFNTADLVQVLGAGRYESQEYAGWAEGDWNGDGWFSTGDFVKALEDGGYELGPRTDAAAVAEPSTGTLALAADVVAALVRSMRRRRRS